jgi:hypothetical protein
VVGRPILNIETNKFQLHQKYHVIKISHFPRTIFVFKLLKSVWSKEPVGCIFIHPSPATSTTPPNSAQHPFPHPQSPTQFIPSCHKYIKLGIKLTFDQTDFLRLVSDFDGKKTYRSTLLQNGILLRWTKPPKKQLKLIVLSGHRILLKFR